MANQMLRSSQSQERQREKHRPFVSEAHVRNDKQTGRFTGSNQRNSNITKGSNPTRQPGMNWQNLREGGLVKYPQG